MIGVAILLAVFAAGVLGVLLRHRTGRTDTLGTVRKSDRTEVGAHAGFTNHSGG